MLMSVLVTHVPTMPHVTIGSRLMTASALLDMWENGVIKVRLNLLIMNLLIKKYLLIN